MQNVHKRSIINRIADKFNDSQKNIKDIIDSFSAEMVQGLRTGVDLEFRGFGVFRVKHRPARKGINPKTQKRVDIEPKKHIHFKMGNQMKKAIRAERQG